MRLLDMTNRGRSIEVKRVDHSISDSLWPYPYDVIHRGACPPPVCWRFLNHGDTTHINDMITTGSTFMEKARFATSVFTWPSSNLRTARATRGQVAGVQDIHTLPLL